MVHNTVSQKGDSIIYASWDTTVNIYSLSQKRKLFSKKTGDICYAKPTVKNNRIYFPSSNEKITCIDLANDKLYWELNIGRRCSNFDFVDDNLIVASIKHYGIIGINIINGEVVYTLRYDYSQTHLPDSSPWPVTFDENNFYASNWQGNLLTCVDKNNGKIKWKFKGNTHAIASKAEIYNNSLFFGTNAFYKAGSLYMLNTSDGKVIYEEPCKYEERMQAVKYKENIYFYSFDKWLNKFDLVNRKLTRILKFQDKHDLSGSQLYPDKDKLFFSDTSFYINMFSITDNSLSPIQKHERQIAWVSTIHDKTYFIY